MHTNHFLPLPLVEEDAQLCNSSICSCAAKDLPESGVLFTLFLKWRTITTGGKNVFLHIALTIKLHNHSTQDTLYTMLRTRHVKEKTQSSPKFEDKLSSEKQKTFMLTNLGQDLLVFQNTS